MPFKFIMPRCCNALSQRIYFTLFYYFNLALRRSQFNPSNVWHGVLHFRNADSGIKQKHIHIRIRTINLRIRHNKCAFTCCVRYLCVHGFWWFYLLAQRNTYYAMADLRRCVFANSHANLFHFQKCFSHTHTATLTCSHAHTHTFYTSSHCSYCHSCSGHINKFFFHSFFCVSFTLLFYFGWKFNICVLRSMHKFRWEYIMNVFSA